MTSIERVARVRAGGHVHWVTDGLAGGLERVEGALATGFVRTGVAIVEPLEYLPPVIPSKIVGVGANFPSDELVPGGKPSFFVKAGSAVVGHRARVELPPAFGSVAIEGEVAVVLGRDARRVRRADAQQVIAGFTIINDFSGRDSTLEYVPPALKKSCDGFAPLGPFISLDPTLRAFEIESSINGVVLQAGTTADLRFSIADVIEYVSHVVTLFAGDVIAMGCPPPKPVARVGDHIAVTVEGLGTLETTLVASSITGAKDRP